MIQQKLTLKTTTLVTLVAIITGTSIHISTCWARMKNGPKALVNQAWQILEHEYVDGTFNHHDWQAVRQEYLSRSYSSKQQAYVAIQEMVAKLGDRYTEFLAPQEYKELNTDTSGKFTGVGIELVDNDTSKALTVIDTIKGSPAFTAGIQPQDVIIKIDGKATLGMNINTFIKHLSGPVGTQVTLTVERGNQELSFKLTRVNIDLHPVSYQVQTTDIGNIGYINLSEFTEAAPAQMRQAIESLERQQVKGYVLDLRSDPGGLLDACLEIANLWLKHGTIVSLAERTGSKQFYLAHGPALTNKPLVVLVDADSASASEILAAALQENNRAILVGTRTFGKGLVQSVERLDDGSALKVTIAKYYTPKGKNINQIGITPDVLLELSEAQQQALIHNQALGTPADPQYAKAITELAQIRLAPRVERQEDIIGE